MALPAANCVAASTSTTVHHVARFRIVSDPGNGEGGYAC
jgi:hypothetical protein